MKKAVLKEGPRAPLFCIGAALLISAGGTTAQMVEQSDLERCTSLEKAELKLACFEALASIDTRESPPAADAALAPPPESAALEPALVTTGNATDIAGPDSGSVAPATTVVAGEDQVDDAGDLGREHPDEEQAAKKKKSVVRSTVSEVSKGGYDVLYFQFTNGQVWRQVESHRFSYPREGEFDVIVSTGMMGDYRLRLDKGGPMIRIRRVK